MNDAQLGDLLVEERLLTLRQLKQALELQTAAGGRIDSAILELGLMSEAQLLQALGKLHRVKTASGADLATAMPEAVRLISPRVAGRYEVVPFRLAGRKLSVASLNPSDFIAWDEIALLTGCMVETHAALEVRLYEALARLYRLERPARLMSVSKRLAFADREPAPQRPQPPPPEQAQPRQPPPVPEKASPDMEPAPAHFAVVEAPPAAAPPPLGRQYPSELEISDEDLAMFPSLQPSAAGEEEDAGFEDSQIEAAVPAPDQSQDTAPELEKPEEPVPEVAPDEPDHIEEETVAPMTAEEWKYVLGMDETDPEVRLAAASVELLDAEMRDDIADSILEFAAPFLRRRLLFILRKDQVVGWRGEGDGVDIDLVRAISLPTNDPSVFATLMQGVSFWLGPLPALPRHQDLLFGLSGVRPSECIVLPVVVKSRMVCFFYGDNGTEPLGTLPIPQLRRLMAKAGVAFQVYILKSKIRTM